MARPKKSQSREILPRLKTFDPPETISADERLMNAMFRAVSGLGCLIDIKPGTAAEEKFGCLLPLIQPGRSIGGITTSSKRRNAKEDDEDDVHDAFTDGRPDRSHVRDHGRFIHHRFDPRDRGSQGSIGPPHGILKVYDLPEARVSPPSPLFPRYLENRTASPARPVFSFPRFARKPRAIASR
jgi:hypothetical protein